MQRLLRRRATKPAASPTRATAAAACRTAAYDLLVTITTCPASRAWTCCRPRANPCRSAGGAGSGYVTAEIETNRPGGRRALIHKPNDVEGAVPRWTSSFMARAEWALPAAAPAPLRCLYLDSDLLVLDKPSGLLCVPGKAGQTRLPERTRARAVAGRAHRAPAGLPPRGWWCCTPPCSAARLERRLCPAP